MSNKELRKALIIRYGVILRRRWYYLLMVLAYFGLGIAAEIDFIHKEDMNPYVIIVGVFAIIGVVVISVVEITRHEKCHYIVPLTYDERKRYYLIGILLNITVMTLASLLYIGISMAINREFGQIVMKVFATAGVPYISVAAFQKINMFKGKKKKDNPMYVYISYFVGVVIGILAVVFMFQFEFLIKNPKFINLIIVLLNALAIARCIYAVIEIIRINTDYENVKVNQMKAMKKLM